MIMCTLLIIYLSAGGIEISYIFSARWMHQPSARIKGGTGIKTFAIFNINET
jgi:hypothetical protein